MNLVIDGNYILNRNVFSLSKDRLLFGHLYDSLQKTIQSYSKWFPFDNIYFVSDSKSNWRKGVYPEYKGNRKKDTVIDWEFVFNQYEVFKSNLPPRFKLLEAEQVEGDDWFYYLTKYHNKLGESVLMISNDGDLKQLLTSGKDYINIMVNENSKKNTIFLPIEYQTWLSTYIDSLPIPGLFDDISDDLQMYKFIKNLISTRIIETNEKEEVIFEKVVAGDRGDNVKTVWGKPDKNGNIRGIGEKTAKKMYQTYLEYFGYPTFNDECFNRITDIIIEYKKLESNEYDKIYRNVSFNDKIVNLNKIPTEIIKKIRVHHGSFIK